MRARREPPFLMWYDDNPKVPTSQKIAQAIEAYSDRFALAPTLVLVNEAEVTEFSGVAVRGASNVRRNTVWVGQEQPRSEALPQAS